MDINILNEIVLNGKNEGIEYYNRGNYKEAVRIFSDIIKGEMGNIDKSVILCNRAACYIMMEDYKNSLIDMMETVRMKPNWSKAWGRLGASLYGLGQYDKAIIAYKKAVKTNDTSNDTSNDIYDNMIKHINDTLEQNKLQQFDTLINNTQIQGLLNKGVLNKELLNKELLNNNTLMSCLQNNINGNVLSEFLSNNKLISKLEDKEFQKTLLSNPMELLKDGDLMDIVSKIMNQL